MKKNKLCDGCSTREPWEHRCHGSNCDCADPICMQIQGKLTMDELMFIMNNQDEDQYYNDML